MTQYLSGYVFKVPFTILLSLALHLTDAKAQAFPCDGEAYLIHESMAELSAIDQTVSPFTLVSIGGPFADDINNMGFRSTDGLLYAYRRTGTVEVVTIDAAGTLVGLGVGGLPPAAGAEYNSGDVSPDGSVMYFNLNGAGALHTLALPGLALIQTVTLPDSGRVADWAAHPTNGLLYGGDDTDGELAIVDPAINARTDVVVMGCPMLTATCTANSLPTGSGFGGAWFNAAGDLMLYENSGLIFQITGVATANPTIISTFSAPDSGGFYDAAACARDAMPVELLNYSVE